MNPGLVQQEREADEFGMSIEDKQIMMAGLSSLKGLLTLQEVVDLGRHLRLKHVSEAHLLAFGRK